MNIQNLEMPEGLKDIIQSIDEASIAKFGCKNYQFIAGCLEEELAKSFAEHKKKKKSYLSSELKLRNMDILEAAIRGEKYKEIAFRFRDLPPDLKLKSTAAFQLIAQKTACRLSKMIADEMELHPPKRIINMYGAHLLDLINKKREQIKREAQNA